MWYCPIVLFSGSLDRSHLGDHQKIYIFQTKDCTCNATPEGLMNIKEAQRQLAEEDEKIPEGISWHLLPSGGDVPQLHQVQQHRLQVHQSR